MLKKTLIVLGIFLALAMLFFGLIQLVPYGRNHTDPGIVQEPAWNDPQTRDLAARACFDCHSSQTNWPWYTNIAPISWLTQHDVDEGRRRLNFSDWNPNSRTVRSISRAISEGNMPPSYYRMIHPSAQLSDAEKQLLIQGLHASGISLSALK